jgi:hypothetical protein
VASSQLTPAPSAFSIKLFLVDGTSEGLRIVEKSNWTGLGLVCTRAQYADVRGRPEFNGAAVYVLLGPGTSSLPRVYVGEAEVLRKRLDQHHASKEFWNRFVAFTSREGGLNKAHVRYLEARLVGLAHAAKRAEVENGTAPAAGGLSEAETADMESFLRDMLLIFPALEVTAFQIAKSPPSDSGQAAKAHTESPAFHLIGPYTQAAGADTPGGFIVQAGAKARKVPVPSIHEWLENIRNSLKEQGILADDGDQWVLTQDYAFDSPSSAAGVLLGRSANGRIEWKTAEGKTLKQIQHESVAPPGAHIP